MSIATRVRHEWEHRVSNRLSAGSHPGAGPFAGPGPLTGTRPAPARPLRRVPPASPPRPSVWPGRLARAAVWIGQLLSRPRVRGVVIGIILLILGATLFSSSVWTLVFLIAGALFLIIAWVGARLEGRFAVEWGEHGTGLEFRAGIKSEPLALAPGGPISEPEPDATTLDQAPHTVQIDLSELRALIAAAEGNLAGVEAAVDHVDQAEASFDHPADEEIPRTTGDTPAAPGSPMPEQPQVVEASGPAGTPESERTPTA